jgi:amino acid transporter
MQESSAPGPVPGRPPTVDTGGGARLRRRIGMKDLLVYGLVFIGPAAPVGVYGALDARSNGVVPVVYVVATIAMGFTAASYALMSSRVPRAGSVFAYASAGIGPKTGFVTGWMVMLDYLLIPSVAYLFTGIAMNSFVPSVPVWVWTAAAVVVTTALNLAGVKVAARVATLVVLAEIIVLGMVLVGAIVVLSQRGPTRDWLSPLTSLGGFSWVAVFGAVSIAVLSFLGFDALATFAEETQGNDSRIIGRATVICLVIAGFLFFAQTYIGALLMPMTPQELAAKPESIGKAYYAMVGGQIAPWLQVMLAVAKALGASFSAMVGQAAAARILMDMGRNRRLPAALASVNARTGVPLVGILVAAIGNVAVAIWAATRDDGLDVLVSIVDVGALVAFVLLHASVVGYFWVKAKDPQRSLWSHVIAPVVGALILITVLINASLPAKLIGLAWLVIGIVVVLLQRGVTYDPTAGADAEPVDHI